MAAVGNLRQLNLVVLAVIIGATSCGRSDQSSPKIDLSGPSSNVGTAEGAGSLDFLFLDDTGGSPAQWDESGVLNLMAERVGPSYATDLASVEAGQPSRPSPADQVRSAMTELGLEADHTVLIAPGLSGYRLLPELAAGELDGLAGIVLTAPVHDVEVERGVNAIAVPGLVITGKDASGTRRAEAERLAEYFVIPYFESIEIDADDAYLRNPEEFVSFVGYFASTLDGCLRRGLTPCQDPQSVAEADLLALNQARQRWEEAGLVSYHFELSVSCECPESTSGPFVVTVVNGVVTDVDYVGSYIPDDFDESAIRIDGRRTIDEFFDSIEDAIDEGVRIDVSYDTTVGYPTTVWLDLDAIAADGGDASRISNLFDDQTG